MVVGFATNYAISAYPHYSCQLKSRSRKVFSIQRLQGTCDKSVVFSETPVSSTNKTDGHNITEMLLKVALNTIKQTNKTAIVLYPYDHRPWQF
jgi:hypothetical protein